MYIYICIIVIILQSQIACIRLLELVSITITAGEIKICTKQVYITHSSSEISFLP